MNIKKWLAFAVVISGIFLSASSAVALISNHSQTGKAGKVLGDSTNLYPYPTGALVNDGGTIYFISGTVKVPFTNWQAFVGLGYSPQNVVAGDLSKYTLSSTYNITTPNEAHPWGSWLVYKGTVYYSSEDGLIGVPSSQVFISDGGNWTYLVGANIYDLAVLNATPYLPLLTVSDSRIYTTPTYQFSNTPDNSSVSSPVQPSPATQVVTPNSVDAPTASLVVNGQTNLTLNIGDMANYVWNSTNASKVDSYFVVDKANTCGWIPGVLYTWVIKTPNGAVSFPAEACDAGVTFRVAFRAYGLSTSSSSSSPPSSLPVTSTVVIKINPATQLAITASLTANGQKDVTLNAGDSINYVWNSTNAVTATSTFTVDKPACDKVPGVQYPWTVTTISGSHTGTLDACQSGATYTITFTVSNPNLTPANASASVMVKVNSLVPDSAPTTNVTTPHLVFQVPHDKNTIELLQDTNFSNGLRAYSSCTKWEGDQANVENIPYGIQLGNCIGYKQPVTGYPIRTLPDTANPNDEGKYWSLNEGYHVDGYSGYGLNIPSGSDLQIFKMEANSVIVNNSASRLWFQQMNNLGLTPNDTDYNGADRLVRTFQSDRQGKILLYENTKNEIQNIATNNSPLFARNTWPHYYIDQNFKQLIDVSQFSSINFSANVDIPFSIQQPGWIGNYNNNSFSMGMLLRRKDNPFKVVFLNYSPYSENPVDYEENIGLEQNAQDFYRGSVSDIGGPLILGAPSRKLSFDAISVIKKAIAKKPSLGSINDYYLASVSLGSETIGYYSYVVNISDVSVLGTVIK